MSHWQDWCDHRNAAMPRTDIEWAVGNDGTPYLRDKEAWSASHAKHGQRQAEQERRKWIWRHNNPEQVTGQHNG